MLLRASGELRGETPDLHAVTGAASDASGVPGGAVLVGFAEAAVRGDETEVAGAREAVRRELGDAATVDAAGVIGNFSRMVRIADGAGIPLDAPVKFFSAGLREELDLGRFGSAAHTAPLSAPLRALSGWLQPALGFAMRRFAGR